MSAPVTAPGAATEELLSELKLASDQAHAANVELGEARVQLEVAAARIAGLEIQRDRLATDALCALSAAGVATPERGYLAEPHVLTANIQTLAAERDAARAEAAALREERDALKKEAEFYVREQEMFGTVHDLRARVSALEGVLAELLTERGAELPFDVYEKARAALASPSQPSEPAPASPTWPYVLAFARVMEAKLAANRHKGDRKGWLRIPPLELLRMAYREGDELEAAIRDEEGPGAIAAEAADVANFAMMIADVAGGLSPAPQPSEPEGRCAPGCRVENGVRIHAKGCGWVAALNSVLNRAAPPPPAKPAEPDCGGGWSCRDANPGLPDRWCAKRRAAQPAAEATEDVGAAFVTPVFPVERREDIEREARDRALEEAAQEVEKGFAFFSRPLISDLARNVRALKSQPSPAPQEPHDTFDLIAHLRRQAGWSEATFGPGERTAGVLDHIRKELREIEANPGDLTEWIDVVILAFDGARRMGFTPEGIATVLAEKQAKNERRKWPDWRTAEPGKAIEHVRDPSEGA